MHALIDSGFYIDRDSVHGSIDLSLYRDRNPVSIRNAIRERDGTVTMQIVAPHETGRVDCLDKLRHTVQHRSGGDGENNLDFGNSFAALAFHHTDRFADLCASHFCSADPPWISGLINCPLLGDD